MAKRYTARCALWASACMGALTSGQAYGQVATTAAQGADSGNGADIIVTARRVEERLQDVPISITVLNPSQIANRNIAVASDLATYTPSLSSNQRFGPEKSSFAIRGFNQDTGTAPTVGVYFADVVGVRAAGGTTSGNTVGAGAFTDLQNVQVLKGPQGTLQGRNTTGGAILLVPQKPTDRLEGRIEGSLGNYGMKRVEAALNIPLADTFKIRFAIDRNQRDGYMINHSGVGPDRYNDLNYFYGRFSMVAELTPTLENYTIAHYSNSDTTGFAASMQICDPNPIDFNDPTGLKNPASANFNFIRVVTNVAGCAQVAKAKANGWGPLDVDVNNANPYVRLKTWQVINTTTWNVSDNLTLKNIASYGEFREWSAFSINNDDFVVPQLPFPLNNLFTPAQIGQPFQHIVLAQRPGVPVAAESTTTEELQVQGRTSNGRLTYVIGGYLEFSRPLSWDSNLTNVYGYCTDIAQFACTAPLGFAIISDSRTQMRFDNNGVYAQGTYKFTDRLSLTLGGRYTFDKIVGVTQSTRYFLAPVGNGSIPVSRVCTDVYRHPGIDILASGDLSACQTTLKQNTTKPTWLVNVEYQPSTAAMIYAKYSRGYRQGGISFTNPGLEQWQPEEVDAYEGGLKTSFHGAISGYFNLALFYNDFRGQQFYGALIARPGAGFSSGAGIVNAGHSRIYGLEVDSSFSLTRALKLDLGYTYLNTKLLAFTAPDLAGTPFQQYVPSASAGDPLTLSPNHRLTMTATYSVPLGPKIGDISLAGTYTYTSSQVANGSTPIGVLPATNLLNLNVSWAKALGSPFDLAFFMTNVTNQIYPVNVGGNLQLDGFDELLYGAPRMWGFRLRYTFGR